MQSVNKKLINNSWQTMKNSLDLEMPVEKKRRPVLIYFWVLAALLGLVFGFFLLKDSHINEEIPNIPYVEHIDEIKSDECNTDFKSAMINALPNIENKIKEHKLSNEGKNLSITTNEVSKPNAPIENIIYENDHGSDSEATSSSNFENGLGQKNLVIDFPSGLSTTSKLQEMPVLALSSLEYYHNFSLAGLPKSIKKSSKTSRFEIEAGASHAFKSQNSGLDVGILGSIYHKKAFHIKALAYFARKRQALAIHYSSTQKSDNMDVNVFIPEDYMDTLVESSKIVNNIGIGLRTNYDVSQNLSLFGGFQVEVPTANFSNDKVFLESNVKNADLISSLNSTLETMVTIGAQYSISDHVAIGASLVHLLNTPYEVSSGIIGLQYNPTNIRLSLAYRF